MANFYTIIVGGKKRTVSRGQLLQYKKQQELEKTDKIQDEQEDSQENSLELLREQYESEKGTNVPNRYKNNAEWIKKQLIK